MSEQRWTAGSLAQSGAEVLAKRGFDQARLESDLLLAFALGLERLDLYTRFDMPIDDKDRAEYRAFIKRRLTHEPVAYILGEKDFLDHTFKVGPGVLIPRPETEHVVAAGATFMDGVPSPRFVEVGCGSGCISLSLLKQFPEAQALALDISEAAIDYTLKNAEALQVADRLICVKSDVFSALSSLPEWRQHLDLVISNPPYVRKNEAESLAEDVRGHEPHTALFCPEDGLAFHRVILDEARAMLTPKGGVVLELGEGTGLPLLQFAQERFPGTLNAWLSDYAGLDRVFCHSSGGWPAGFDGLHGHQLTSDTEAGD